MKKTLIALAAVAATGAAFAQSSVTLYGVADVAVGKTNQAGLGLATDKFQAIAANVLNNGNSRFGMKGTEDLGGGLKAGFNFEGGINIANGAGNTSGGQLFSRAANISLMGGFGEIRAGRSLTTSFYSVASWELTGTANYSVVANQFSFAGAGPRASGQVMYTSPSMGGFKVSAATVLKGNGSLNGNTDLAAYDLSATYAAGPITASLAYNKVDTKEKNIAIGGKYDFGTFAVAGSYQDPAGAKKGFTIGASAPMGPVTLTADIARATNTADKNTDFLLEAKYALSKRTFVYGVYMRDGAVSGAKSTNGYAVGVRHNF
jgi:predicted porin